MQSPVTNEDAIVAVAAVEDTVPGGDSQPAVAVDSSDLGTVSPAPVPFVPTLGAWAKPLKLSPSALSVQRKFGSNLLQDLSYPTSHWPSLPSGQREGHTKNMATPVPNKGPMVTVAGGDSQPVVAVDSPDLRSTVFSPVSPASVPLVRTYSRSLGKTPEDPSAFFFFWVGRTMGRWFEPTPRSVRHVPALESKADVTVSKDGSGKFTTVKEAVASAPENSKTRYTILVKRGTYLENVIIGKNKTNLTILGEGSNLTTITGSWNHVDGKGTYDSATLGAVALRVSADKAVIYRCRMDAYQDTLYAHIERQFYRECYITGTVDFICGQATAVFQNCDIVARKPLQGQQNMITAQQCQTQSRDTWFSIHKCKIRAAQDLIPVKGTVKTFLGRPWGDYATVVFMKSAIDDLIDPAGWAPWDNDERRLSTLFYGEYQNSGPGAGTVKRVTWKGFKVITDPKEAEQFTVGKLLQGESWIRSTGVPYEERL
ncbi:hypothetical protein HID58_081006 [Brassica napus]|uniref:Pectinesterase catalytic domain-containing protein n=1 Tax=Brassica napus TaxID=3708 RepID=A0ABQ7Y6H0_BRANA|nr:hypothetical protein HID58_081006 [Brassica napus]